LSTPSGNRIVIIPVSSHQYIAFEYRTKSTIDYGLNKPGILVYQIDFRKGNFEVPITLFADQSILSQPYVNNFKDWQRYKNAPLGEFEIADAGKYRISSMGNSSEGNFWVSNFPIDEIKNQLASMQKLAADKATADKAAAAKKPVAIVCIKGKVVKRVTGNSPKCPSGYSLKK
jgi:hypothetical protein